MTFDELKALDNLVVTEETESYIHVDSVEGYSMKHNNIYSKCFFIPKVSEELSELEVVKDEDIIPIEGNKILDDLEEPEIFNLPQ